MILEQIVDFEPPAEHAEAFVAAEPLEVGGMRAALGLSPRSRHPKSLRHGAGLDDLRHAQRRDDGNFDTGQGRGSRQASFWHPDAGTPEHRSRGDAGTQPPGFQAVGWAELGVAGGQGQSKGDQTETVSAASVLTPRSRTRKAATSRPEAGGTWWRARRAHQARTAEGIMAVRMAS